MSELEPKHPSKLFPNSLLWHDRSHQPEAIQIIDLLSDIRLLLFAVFFLLLISQ